MAREQFIDACRSLGAALIYAPDGNDLLAGSVRDLSGNHHDGTLKNGASIFTPGLIANGDSVAVLDTKSQYIDSNWTTRTNYVANPRVVNTGQWAVRSTGTFAVSEGQGKPDPQGNPTNAILMVRSAGVPETVYMSTTPGVASNGVNAPEIKGNDGKWITVVFQARARDVPRTCTGVHIFANAEKESGGTPSGGAVVVPVSADPNATVTVWFSAEIPAGTITDNFRLQGAGMAEGDGIYISQPYTFISSTQPKTEADLPGFWPTVGQLSSGIAGYSGTVDHSFADIGPWSRGTSGLTIAVMASRESSGFDELVGGSTKPPYFGLGNASQTVAFSVDGVEFEQWPNAWPGDGIPTLAVVTFNDPLNTAELELNGRLIEGPKAHSASLFGEAAGNLVIGVGGELTSYWRGSILPFAFFTRPLSAGERRILSIAADMAAAAYIPPPGQIVLQVVTEGGAGRGYDLTDEAEGLVYSNSNPGGDESCSFNLHRDWFAENPEIARGDIVRVISGIDTLWVGRIEDNDRSTGDAETIGITAYGLGNRFSDAAIAEIYVDRDMTRWGAMPNDRVVELGNTWQTDAGGVEIRQAPGTGLPALTVAMTAITATPTRHPITEAWYDAAGVPISSVYYEVTSFDSGAGGYGLLSAAGGWGAQVGLASSPAPGVAQDESGSILPSKISSLVATTTTRTYAYLQLSFTSTAENANGDWRLEFRKLAVYGNHGLTTKGEAPGGFSADQIVGNIVTRAAGISIRNMTTFGYVIPQFVIPTPVALKQGIEEASKFASVDYGVWGPESIFDRSATGYFDYTEKDTATQHWSALRSDFEGDLSFHSETASLYDTVKVTYQNETGKTMVETFSTFSPELAKANLSGRTYSMDAGTTTAAGAAIFANIFLDLFGGFAPARGSGTFTGKVTHYRRGQIPAYYMRADGSNIRVPDILPAETTFALSSTPDRRTTFPIKRVSVDCSGDIPRTTVEFDQTAEALAILLAQQAAEASLVGV